MASIKNSLVMIHESWPFDEFVHIRQSLKKNCSSVLDLGCGTGNAMRHIRSHKNIKVIGIDLFPDYIKQCKRIKIYDDLILSDVRVLPIRKNVFDVVLLLDVLEHLKKSEGRLLLRKIEKLAKKRLVVYTPVNYLPQNTVDENVYQQHKSGWCPDEMRTLGYDIKGVNSFYILRTELSKIRYSGIIGILISILSHLMDPLFYFFPKYSFHMLCLKTITKNRSYT